MLKNRQIEVMVQKLHNGLEHVTFHHRVLNQNLVTLVQGFHVIFYLFDQDLISLVFIEHVSSVHTQNILKQRYYFFVDLATYSGIQGFGFVKIKSKYFLYFSNKLDQQMFHLNLYVLLFIF